MTTLNIETITNNLAEGYNQLEEGTFQEAAEVQVQRRTDADFRNRWVYTANLPIFRMQQGTLEYGLSGRETFDAIAGADIGEFTRQILQKGAYALTPEQIELLGNPDIVWAKADDLALQECSKEWGYFLLDTSDLEAKRLNEAQRLFAKKVHGSLTDKYDAKQELPDYAETMSMLKKGRIKQTGIWLPTQKHIKRYLDGNEAVARASWLGSFGDYSDFYARDRLVDLLGALRGVPIIVREADARKIEGTDPITAAYEVLLENVGDTAKKTTPKQAEGLLKVLLAFQGRQKQ